MLVTLKGIVLHHFKYSEKSVIAKIYTDKYGLQSYIINGVRSSKSKNKAVYLQPLSLVEINTFHKEKKGLQQVKTIQLVQPYTSIPFNIAKTSIAFFLAETLYKSIREEESNTPLFEFLFNAFQQLDLKEKNYSNFHLIFLGKLCQHMGIQPQKIDANCMYFDLREGRFISIAPAHKDFLAQPYCNQLISILNADFTEKDLCLNKKDRNVLLTTFINYFNLHLSNFESLKSLPVLKEVLD